MHRLAVHASLRVGNARAATTFSLRVGWATTASLGVVGTALLARTRRVSCEASLVDTTRPQYKPVGVLRARPQTHFALITSLLDVWDWFLFACSASCSLLVSLVSTRQVRLIGTLFDSIGTPDAAPALLKLLGVFVLQSGLSFASAVTLGTVTTRLGERLRLEFFSAIIQQDMEFFDRVKTGELANQLGEDIGQLQTAIRECFTRGVEAVTTLVSGSLLLYSASPHVAAAMGVLLPVGAASGYVFARGLRTLSRETREAASKATGLAAESFQGIQTVRSLVAEDAVAQAYGSELQRGAALKQRMAVATAGFYSALNLGVSLTTMVLFALGHRLVGAGEMTKGDLAVVVTNVQMLERALNRLTQLISQVSLALKSSEHIVHKIAQAPLVNTVHAGGRCLLDVKGLIEFRRVGFSYPTRKQARVLDELSLVVQPGTMVALVGASGSGKSTLAALLERFYDVDSGAVLLDGVDIRQLDPQWLRRNIGYVNQHPDLFSGSIKDNIRFGAGRPVADEEIYEAARKAHAHGFISDFPAGYDTMLGEGGAQLSGGQRQRIAIARTLLQDPKILLLDEITSGLDAESEHLVQKALDQLMMGRTTICIAHRLITVMNAACIFVLEDGAVIERGAHDELVAKPNGAYRAFFERQGRLRRRATSRSANTVHAA